MICRRGVLFSNFEGDISAAESPCMYMIYVVNFAHVDYVSLNTMISFLKLNEIFERNDISYRS